MLKFLGWGLVALLVLACQNPSQPSGAGSSGTLSLQWTLASGDSRTILPGAFPSPATYDIVLQPASGSAEVVTGLTGTTWRVQNLALAVYSVSVTGKDATGAILVRGTGTVDLTATGSGTLSVPLSYVSSGTGTGQIHLTLDFGSLTDPVISIVATLVNPAGTVVTPTLGPSALQYSDTAARAGMYQLFLRVRTASSTALRMETIQVFQNVDTAFRLTFVPGEFGATFVPVTALSLDKSLSTLVVGESQTLTKTFSPPASNTLVTWSSSHPLIAEVTQTGVVTAVAVGSATITATSVEDPTKVAVCAYTVTPATVVPGGFPELLANGNFDLDGLSWSTTVSDGGAATWSYAGGRHSVALTNPGPNVWSVHTFYTGAVPLEQGAFYEISFDASSDGARFLEISLNEGELDVDGDGTTYDNIATFRPYLGSSTGRFTYRFVMKERTNPGVHVEFQMGRVGLGTHTVLLDNVSLRRRATRVMTNEDVPDAVVRSALAAKVGKVWGTVTDADLSRVDKLNLSGVTDGTGIALCTNLLDLSLDESPSVNSLAFLTGLTGMTRLYVLHCPVANIDVLASFHGLRDLELVATRVPPAAWGFLVPASFPALSFLHIDAQNFPSGTYRYADFAHFATDFRNLSGLGLSFFALTDADLTDLVSRLLVSSPTLTDLRVYDNQLTKASLVPLARLTSLKFLNFKNNPLGNGATTSDLGVLSALTRIQRLDASNVGLESMSGTSGNELQFLKDWYDASGTLAFHTAADGPSISLAGTTLNLTTGTTNRTVVDYLESHSVSVRGPFRSTSTSVTGTITLPSPVTAKKWYVIVDTDLIGNNGITAIATGTVTGGTVSYSLANLPSGRYFVYADVETSGHWGGGAAGPAADGDFQAIYGYGSVPTTPVANLTIPRPEGPCDMTAWVYSGPGSTLTGTVTLPVSVTNAKYYLSVNTTADGSTGAVTSTNGVVTGSTLTYTITNVPAGTYYLSGCVDVNGHWGSNVQGAPDAGDVNAFYGITAWPKPGSPNLVVSGTGSTTWNLTGFLQTASASNPGTVTVTVH